MKEPITTDQDSTIAALEEVLHRMADCATTAEAKLADAKSELAEVKEQSSKRLTLIAMHAATIDELKAKLEASDFALAQNRRISRESLDCVLTALQRGDISVEKAWDCIDQIRNWKYYTLPNIESEPKKDFLVGNAHNGHIPDQLIVTDGGAVTPDLEPGQRNDSGKPQECSTQPDYIHCSELEAAQAEPKELLHALKNERAEHKATGDLLIKAKARVKELEQDKARLDWMDRNKSLCGGLWYCDITQEGHETYKDAIDAAMKEESK